MQIILSECLKSRFFLHFSHDILYKKSVHFFEKLHTMAFMIKNKISTFDNWKMWLSSLFWLEPCAGGICLRERQWQSEVLCIAHKKWGLMFPKWRIKRGETLEIGAIREIQEETWYSNISIKKWPQLIYAFYHVGEKWWESNIERWNKANFFLCELENDANSGQSLTSDEIGMWYKRVNKEELLSIFSQHWDKRDLWNAFMRQWIDSVLDNQEPSNSQLATNSSQLVKYDFVVHPGGNPELVKLKIKFATANREIRTCDLIVSQEFW